MSTSWFNLSLTLSNVSLRSTKIYHGTSDLVTSLQSAPRVNAAKIVFVANYVCNRKSKIKFTPI
eukprot:UN16373